MGLLMVGLDAAFSRIMPVYLTSAILLVTLVVASRGLHLDGFMDVCDGLFGGYTRERRLEIMRDSHVGAFAVAGAICLMLLKWTAILSLLSLPESGKVWGLILFPTLSRWAMVLVMAAFPYVRSQGLGSPFHQGPYLVTTLLGAALALLASLLLAGLGGVVIFLGATILAWLMGKAMVGFLGGLTGDTYGATNEVTEVVTLGTTVALIPHGLISPLHEMLGVA